VPELALPVAPTAGPIAAAEGAALDAPADLATVAVASPAMPARKAAPWRGRKRVADARTKFVGIRCTPTKLAEYETAAAKAGLSIGAYFRALADGTPGPRAVRRPPVEREQLARLLGQIGKLGSNVNQLTHAAHAGGAMLTHRELTEIAADVKAMRADLMKALGRGD